MCIRDRYNIVGFQTNLKWGEQKRVFSMIPGLENAEFVRYGVMHRNTFLDAVSYTHLDVYKRQGYLSCRRHAGSAVRFHR